MAFLTSIFHVNSDISIVIFSPHETHKSKFSAFGHVFVCRWVLNDKLNNSLSDKQHDTQYIKHSRLNGHKQTAITAFGHMKSVQKTLNSNSLSWIKYFKEIESINRQLINDGNSTIVSKSSDNNVLVYNNPRTATLCATKQSILFENKGTGYIAPACEVLCYHSYLQVFHSDVFY